MKNILALMRPHQYVKNIFIFLPLFFVGSISDQVLLLNAFWAFLAFSLAASAIYTLNDFFDIEEDRAHPTKKFRPLASGVISKNQAFALFTVLIVISLVLMFYLSQSAGLILLGYIIMNIAYSLSLKHIALVDITIIAVGFILRLFIGSVVTNVALSMWIVIITFLLALFLALAKRRDDVLLFINTGKKMRKVIDGYNLQLIDTAMTIMAAGVIVSYILYTTSTSVVQRMHIEYLYLTTIFVILGVLRYLQITLVEENSGSPTRIVLNDGFTQFVIVAWFCAFGWILYL